MVAGKAWSLVKNDGSGLNPLLLCNMQLSNRIIMNLKMCGDYHRVAKLVSKVYNKEVIVRDKTW